MHVVLVEVNATRGVFVILDPFLDVKDTAIMMTNVKVMFHIVLEYQKVAVKLPLLRAARQDATSMDMGC